MNTKQAFQKVKTLTGCGPKTSCTVSDPETLSKDLNTFFTHFDHLDFSPECQDLLRALPPPDPEEQAPFTEEEVWQQLSRCKPGKAPGPDGIPAKVIRDYCNNALWQTATIIPVPNKFRPTELNHYRPIALTSIIMKCLEKLLLYIILPVVTPHLDPLQFAYKARRGTEDAVACLLHLLLQYLNSHPQTTITPYAVRGIVDVCEEHLLSEQEEWNFRMVKEEPQPSYLKEENKDPLTPHFKAEEEVPETPHFIKKVKDPLTSNIKWNKKEPLTPHFKKEEEAPQTLNIKEEEVEHSISQEGEHIEGLEEFPVTGVPVKSEDDEVKGESEEKREAEPPSSSSTQHMTTEADGDLCGGSQADKLLAPLSDSEDTTSHSPDTDDEDSKDDKTCHTDNTHFTCSHCDKTFKYHCHLKVHMRTHTGEKPFICSVCNEGFRQRQNLKRHMRIHTGETPFICSICGKGFAESRNLTRHKRTHTGEKSHSCSICSKYFVQSQHLKVHMRTHTGEKPFSCSICGKGFTQSHHLNVHKRTHTGEKSFSCSICSRSFCDQSNLIRHMRRHPGEKALSCSVCFERFSYKYQCEKHKCIGENSSSK
ncbi:zinc finger protein 514-like [Nerophis ophidion]|uniref:zinc finger protein 514-like n=1 Tax=Nerophis ophidion TaxID=159077 RepID=UPI002AE08786|nr:zinc finger protein 514-like [Nerophis ophidion]